jgi:hypothetical protein
VRLTKRQLRSIIESELRLINEGGTVGTVVSGILSIPMILNGIAKIIERRGEKKHNEKAIQRGENLEHFAHDLHKLYRKPISFLIKKSAKAMKKELSPKQIENYTDIFFAILVILLLKNTVSNIKAEIMHLEKHVEMATVALTVLETAMGSLEVVEESQIIAHLRDRNKQKDLANAIDTHVQNHH